MDCFPTHDMSKKNIVWKTNFARLRINIIKYEYLLQNKDSNCLIKNERNKIFYAENGCVTVTMSIARL